MIFRSAKSPVEPITQAWLEFSLQWLVERIGPDTLSGAESVSPDRPEMEYGEPLQEDRFIDLVDFFAGQLAIDSEQLVVSFDNIESYSIVDQSRIGKLENELTDADQAAAIREQIENSGPSILKTGRLLLDLPVQIAATRTAEWQALPLFRQVDSRTFAELYCFCLGLGPLFATLPARQVPNTFGAAETPGPNTFLSTDEMGYLLGLRQIALAESQPPWFFELRLDVQKAMKQTLRYLQTTEPFFSRDHLRSKVSGGNMEVFRNLLESTRNVDQIIALMWLLPQIGYEHVQEQEVLQRSRSKDVAIRHAATVVLSELAQRQLQGPESEACYRLAQLIEDRDSGIRSAAAQGLGHATLDRHTVEHLCLMLRDSDRLAAQSAGFALRTAKSFADFVIPRLCQAISFSVVRGESSQLETLVDTLDEICDAPEEHLIRTLDHNEHDFLFAVTDLLREIRVQKQAHAKGRQN